MNFRFSECTYELVLDYSQYLQEVKKLANSTVNQRLAAIKSYLKYVSDGDIDAKRSLLLRMLIRSTNLESGSISVLAIQMIYAATKQIKELENITKKR